MKLRLTYLFLLAVIFILGCASTKQTMDGTIANSEIRVYEVFGMDCPGCHDGVENLVNKVRGVKGSEANWEKAKIEVAVQPDSNLTDEAIYEAIKKANFTPGKRME